MKYESFKYKPMSGGDCLIGIVVLKMRVMNIEENTRFFVIDKRDLKYDVVLGLDSVVKFRLRLNEKLELSQKEVDAKEEKEIIWNENEISVNWNEYIQVEEFQIRTGHLDEMRKKAIYDLVDRYGGCASLKINTI